MLFPIIKIKEKTGDKEFVHIVGTNSHDNLIIKGNSIHYLKSQGMVGTQYPSESGMYFVGQDPDEYSFLPYATVEMVTIEKLIEIAEKNMVKQTESSLRLHDSFRKYLALEEECKEKRNKDDVFDTSGMLF